MAYTKQNRSPFVPCSNTSGGEYIIYATTVVLGNSITYWSRWLFRLQTGNCRLRARLRRLGFLPTVGCPCEANPQTLEHVSSSNRYARKHEHGTVPKKPRLQNMSGTPEMTTWTVL